MTYTDDDLINAALIEDEEDKREREEAEKADPDKPEVTPSEEADAPAPAAAEDEEDEPDDLDKPEEAEPAKAEPASEDGDKLTRKERRESKRQAWLESVRKEQRQQEQAPQQIQQQPAQPQQPEQPYQPIDYRTVDEINEQELEKDRQTYAEIQRRNGEQQGRQSERFVAEQHNFWKDVEHEAKLLQYDPEFKFLDDTNPDTFDEDLTLDLNEKYLQFVGHNPQNNTVRRTDISYEKFVRKELADRKAYAERLAAESTANLQETKANTGLRPGGGNRKSGIGTLKPGDISKMSDADLEKYEDEIDRQILSAFQ